MLSDLHLPAKLDEPSPLEQKHIERESRLLPVPAKRGGGPGVPARLAVLTHIAVASLETSLGDGRRR